LKTSEWLGIIVANTFLLETTLADVEVQTDDSAPIQGSSSGIKDYKTRLGNNIYVRIGWESVTEEGKQAGAGNAGTGGCRTE